MKQFPSIEKLDTGILYTLELASSLSVILLAIGLMASMANVLTDGNVLTGNPAMEQVWAWVQCGAIDLSVPGTIIRTISYYNERERVKTWLYVGLSALLLFTACIVSNIESVQQTLNITLSSAYTHVFVPVEVLIWVRSLAVVLLIVAHAVRHVQTFDKIPVTTQTIVVAEEQKDLDALPEPKTEELPEQETDAKATEKLDNYGRVKEFLDQHPKAKVREVADALQISLPTANKWMIRVRDGEHPHAGTQKELEALGGSERNTTL